MKFHILLCLCTVCTALSAQVQINKPIHLNGGTSDRRITNLADPTAADQAVNAGVVQTGALVFAAETGAANAYVVNLSPAITVLTTGMIVNFRVGTGNDNTGASTLKVNTVSPVAIKKAVTAPLTAGDIVAGQMVSVMFDGTFFQLLSGTQGPQGPQGIQGTQGNTGPAGSANINGNSGYMIKFTGNTTGGNSLLYDDGAGLGIGTTAPNAKLEIVGSTQGLRLRNTVPSGYTGMRIFNDQNDIFRALEIDYSGSTYPSALMGGGIVGEAASIATTGNFPIMLGTSNTARLTILGNGNVGIGTVAPAAKLEINGTALFTGTAFGKIYDDGGGGIRIGGTGSASNLVTDGSGAYSVFLSNAGTVAGSKGILYLGAGNVTSPTGGDGMIQMYTSALARITVLRDGNVGIATLAPGMPLDVQGSIRTYNGNGITANATDKGFLIAGTSGSHQVQIDNDEIQAMLGNATSNLYINANGANTYINAGAGNTGIGTTAPSARLQVNAGGGTGSAFIISRDYTNVTQAIRGGEIDFIPAVNGGSTAGSIITTNYYGAVTEGRLTLNTWSRSNQLVLHEGGNVGVGIAVPTNTLQVHGVEGLRIGQPTNPYWANLVFGSSTTIWSSGIRVYDNANAEMRLWHANSSGQIVIANGYNGDQSTTMPTDGMFVVGDGGVNRVGIGYNATDIRGNGGKLLVNGKVGIGTTTPGYALHVVSGVWQGSIMADAPSASNYSSLGISAGGVRQWSFYNHPGVGNSMLIANNAGTDVFAIKQDGHVGIGNNGGIYQVQVSGSLNAGYILLGDNNNNSNNTIEYVNPGTTVYREGFINYYGTGYLGLCWGGGYVSIGPAGTPAYRVTLPNTSGTGGTGAAWLWGQYSDGRLKSDREPLKYGLHTIMQLQPLQYFHHNSTVKDDKLVIEREGAHSFGLVAQEVYKLIPEMAIPPKDESKELWVVDYSKLGPILVKAMQEQQQTIEQQQKQLDELNKKLILLETKIK